MRGKVFPCRMKQLMCESAGPPPNRALLLSHSRIQINNIVCVRTGGCEWQITRLAIESISGALSYFTDAQLPLRQLGRTFLTHLLLTSIFAASDDVDGAALKWTFTDCRCWQWIFLLSALTRGMFTN